jgi:potassium large conductance calcium-activated channel subfamily M alpha protein 1
MCDDESVISPEEAECLKERKWWCFLLSSIFTFLAGLALVLIWRALAFICCRKAGSEYSAPGPQDPKMIKPGEPNQIVQIGPVQPGQKPGRAQPQEFEASFMTEAKDWAGELISGQTTTGRILVSTFELIDAIFSIRV